MKKFITLALAICMALSASVFASAAEVNSDGGSGSTPVYLSSTEDGTLDGDPSATAMSVTVPTALPMAMSQTGDVTTADNCRIVNNSYGAVRVKSVTITAENGNQTLCIYSTGNAISNQRREYMNLNTGHTEDGVIVELSFAKYSEGTVLLEVLCSISLL